MYIETFSSTNRNRERKKIFTNDIMRVIQDFNFILYNSNLLFHFFSASGLKFLNQKGIIHRDIKPGNILKGIEEDGGSVNISVYLSSALVL